MNISNTQTTLPPLTVSQLTNAIKMSLETTFPCIHLQGEISNIKIQTSGHLYFSLKDAHSQISVVMFKADASLLKTLPKGGDQVIVKGEINVYPPKGNYQLIIRELSYLGLGELLLKLEQLKIKLHQMGWFKSSRKKPLPRFPLRIGVVTSPTGAVIQDILHVLTRRYSGFQLILNPVKVQGEGSAGEIAKAIEQFNRYQLVDVMIVGRGGGSLEDLWAFNEEIVASAIYHSQIPVISAVGHETDHCIADYVADVRAPTPSAAAEIVVPEKKQHLDYLNGLQKRMQHTLRNRIQQNRLRMNGVLKHPHFSNPRTLLEWRMQQMDDCRIDIDLSMQRFLEQKKQLLNGKSQQTLALKPSNQIAYFKERIFSCDKALRLGAFQRLAQERQKITYKSEQISLTWEMARTRRRQLFNKDKMIHQLQVVFNDRISFHRQKLNHIINLLNALDPRNILKKGYSILFAEKGSFVINSITKMKQGQQARILLSDGEAIITIQELIPHDANTRNCDTASKF